MRSALPQLRCRGRPAASYRPGGMSAAVSIRILAHFARERKAPTACDSIFFGCLDRAMEACQL